MKVIKIEVRDNPQSKDLNKIIKDIREKFLDLGLIVRIEITEE